MRPGVAMFVVVNRERRWKETKNQQLDDRARVLKVIFFSFLNFYLPREGGKEE